MSDTALTWRVFCDSETFCPWRREGFADRESARAAGRAHIALKHAADTTWEFRVQGVRHTSSWEVVADEPHDEDTNTDRALKILAAVHLLDSVRDGWRSGLDDDVFLLLAACQTALDAVKSVYTAEGVLALPVSSGTEPT